MKLVGKIAIITGASQGFGFVVAQQFVAEGARVMLCARDAVKLKAAQTELLKFAQNPEQIQITEADVSVKEDVDLLLKNTLNKWGQVDILVSNAGIYGPKGPIEEVDWDEWSHAIDVNLKGTVLLCRAVVPSMKKNKQGKIILLSGGGATKPMPFLSSYAAAKAAVVRFGDSLAEELQDYHIDVNSIAPGALNTRLLDEILAAGPEKVGQHFYQQSLKQKEQGGAPLEKGAALAVFLASDESDGISGRLISAIWDPWAKLPAYLSELKISDIYTLRRIVPEDRAKAWS